MTVKEFVYLIQIYADLHNINFKFNFLTEYIINLF
jgi:hypothetical protein